MQAARGTDDTLHPNRPSSASQPNLCRHHSQIPQQIFCFFPETTSQHATNFAPAIPCNAFAWVGAITPHPTIPNPNSFKRNPSFYLIRPVEARITNSVSSSKSSGSLSPAICLSKSLLAACATLSTGCLITVSGGPSGLKSRCRRNRLRKHLLPQYTSRALSSPMAPRAIR